MSDNWVVQNLEKSLERWNSTINEIWRIVTLSPQQFGSGDVWDRVSVINEGIRAVAYALVVLFFVSGVMKTCSTFAEVKRPEHAVKMFIRFALAKAAVEHAMDILSALTEIIQGIINSVMESALMASPDNAVLPDEIVQAIENTDFIASIPLWIVGIIASVAIWVLSFVLILSVYGRFFRIFMYTAIAPVPLSAFAGEPTARIGISFIRSYAAVCLEGAVVVIACVIFSIFVSEAPSVSTDTSSVTMVWEYMGQLIFNMLILVGCVKMSEKLVHEMLGL